MDFETFKLLYHRLLVGHASRWLRKRPGMRHALAIEAEDIVQETLIRAYRHYGTLEDKEHAEGWLIKVQTNIIRDHWRAAKRRPRWSEIPDAGSIEDHRTSPPVTDLLASMPWLARHAARLPGKMGELLDALGEFGGDVHQIARKLKRTEKGVVSAIRKLHDRLVDELGWGDWIRTFKAYDAALSASAHSLLIEMERLSGDDYNHRWFLAVERLHDVGRRFRSDPMLWDHCLMAEILGIGLSTYACQVPLGSMDHVLNLARVSYRNGILIAHQLGLESHECRIRGRLASAEAKLAQVRSP